MELPLKRFGVFKVQRVRFRIEDELEIHSSVFKYQAN